MCVCGFFIKNENGAEEIIGNFLSTYNPAEVIWIANTGLTYNIYQRGTVFVCHVDNNSVYTLTKILIVKYF